MPTARRSAHPSAHLPAAPDAALAVSGALQARLVAAARAAGDWLGFDRYMAIALYEPGLGYYAGGSVKLGEAGDFVTAPIVSPLFGECVAAQCLQWLQGGAVARRVTEFGAGDGELAAQLLTAFEAAGAGDVAYDIVELSADLAQRQRERLARRVPQALGRVRWLRQLPERLSGVVLGNELLDAMPVRLFVLQGGRVCERGVATVTDPAGGPASLCWADRPAGAAFADAVRARLAAAGTDPATLPDGYVSEIGEQAAGWVRTVAERLSAGAVLLIDYGFPAPEYYHPQRHAGTLMCHYRHHAHTDPLWQPGLSDITAHVDFDAIAQAAADGGATLLGYTTQAHFLINCGLLDRFGATRGGDPLAAARAAAAVGRLVSEAEMGELFKVIAFGRDVADDAIGFARGDRRHRLAGAAA